MKLNGIELTEFEEQIHDIGMIAGTMTALGAVTIFMAITSVFNNKNDFILSPVGWALAVGVVFMIYIIKIKSLQADD